MNSFYNLARSELGEALKTAGFDKFRAAQLFKLVYQNDFDAKYLPAALTKWLEANLQVVPSASIESEQVSCDGTRKFLLSLAAASRFKVESVLIPEANRATLCVSSQVGCSLSCTFCHTGTQKFMRNLETSEIISQYLIASRKGPLSNVVFMGQGEPLYNWQNVRRAVHILTDPLGIGLGRGKIVVSTSGIVPAIPRIASELGVQLAVSLHATNDALRSELMPINKTFPLAELMKACGEFVALSSSSNRRITFEYVMLDGINDDVSSDGKGLISLLARLPAHVNLIPFNPWPGSTYRASSDTRVMQFSEHLNRSGLACTIRWPRGNDILAACGQLKSASETKIAAVA